MSTTNTRKKFQETTHYLPPIRIDTANNRRPRPPTAEESKADRIPLRSPAMTTREHKSGFRSIFRSKADKENNPISPVLDAPLLSPASFRIPSKSPLNSPTLSDTFQSRTFSLSSNPRKEKDVKPKKDKNNLAATKSKSTANLASHNTCDPLPLFRVYPQSIKHDKLACSTMAADTIIRISNHKKKSIVREDISHNILPEEKTGGKKTALKKEKNKTKHKRQLSGSISKAEWTEKIYVLVTSGFLMQYAAEGSFDRLPEKMLQLSKDSVVFASDAIPGRLFVLQVSQAVDPEAASRSLLSKLSFRHPESRRTSTSFLLILSNAEELVAWQSAIRREIENLGGKKHSEIGRPDDDEEPMTSPLTSPRVIPRSPERPWNSFAPRPLSTIRPSLDCPSISTSATSKEDTLENLRDNSHHRLSHLSSDPPTIGTSRGSSCSPSRDTFRVSDGYSVDQTPDRRRRQTMDISVTGHLAAPKPLRPQSTMIQGGRNLYDFSPSPNRDSPGHRAMANSNLRSPPGVSSTRPLTPMDRSGYSAGPIYTYNPRPDNLHAPHQDRSARTPDLSRPQTASGSIESPKRFPSLAPPGFFDLTLPPARPPPPPPKDSPPAKPSVRRPVSMQARTSPPVSMHTHPMSPTYTSAIAAPLSPPRSPPRSSPRKQNPSVLSAIHQSPPTNRSKSAQVKAKNVQNRRSLPHLAEAPYSPPLGPPPEGDLPPLPTGVAV